MPTEAETDFVARPWVAMLGVSVPDRAPLVIPVWYALDGDGNPWFVSPKTSLKSRLIEASGKLTLTMQRETRPYAYVSVAGAAMLKTAVPDDILEMATRYLGQADGAAYAASMADAMAAGTRWRITLTLARWSSYGLT